ncbi:hypothetical protein [Halodesulfovibrio marinisediminis]|uniref:Uncharacterized protein n=1 Tax=Halodesulfovibrio marinisediminis DSM 17456 TaxID=1121457 RepID=A0A1N6I401_9BACT|nr:hypothetical protein [Halodesulfovibrio marinisediminis]SIO26767.1 hypothetical protein SAMN02745161_2397 [Halodesulfovibrio marinisediminis DSM 17456]
MFDAYERLPEWLRWLLLIPLFFGIMYAFSLIFRLLSIHLAGAFIYDRVFAPLAGGAMLVFVATRLIPRAKLLTAYVLCCFWLPLFTLSTLSVFFNTPTDGNLTRNDLVQGAFALIGSLAATIQAHKKYRKR